MTKKISGMLAILVVTSWAGMASAALSDAIGSLAPGSDYRVIFATSLETPGNNDIVDYNELARRLGTDDFGVGGTVTEPLDLSWRALVSAVGRFSTDVVNAQDNTNTPKDSTAPVSIFNTNGDLLATSYSDLWDGLLMSPVGYDEFGQLGPGIVWTGTDAGGLTLFPLGPSQPAALFGVALVQNDAWMRSNLLDPTGQGAGIDAAFNQYSIYAISELATTVPIPAAVWLFGSAIGLFGLIGRKSTT